MTGYFIINLSLQFTNDRNFTIGEHLPKFQAKWLTVSYAPFTLDFCCQRCRTRRISKISCVLRTETVFVVMLIGRLIWIYYQQISNCWGPIFTYWLTHLCHQWLADCWSCKHFAVTSFCLLHQLCTIDNGIFYGWRGHHFVSELSNAYFTRQIF